MDCRTFAIFLLAHGRGAYQMATDNNRSFRFVFPQGNTLSTVMTLEGFYEGAGVLMREHGKQPPSNVIKAMDKVVHEICERFASLQPDAKEHAKGFIKRIRGEINAAAMDHVFATPGLYDIPASATARPGASANGADQAGR